MELKLNVVPLYNVLPLLNNMLVHAMSSSNTNLLKSASFVNFNDLVLPQLIHKLIFNNMALNFLMLLHLFNKLVLLVLSKIS